MTIFDDEFNKLFRKMSSSFFDTDDIFEEFKTKGATAGPFYYGYTMTVGPDGKPLVKEYGNVKARHSLAASLEHDQSHIYVWVERSTDPYILKLKKESG